jgi:hypothetical protein
MSFSENPNNTSKDFVQGTLAGEKINLPEGPKVKEDGTEDGKFTPLEGQTSLLHTLSVLHYSDFSNQGPGFTDPKNNPSNFFNGDNPTGYRNPTGSQIVSSFDESAVQHAMQYKWGDFIFVDNYGKVPNNHLITLRRFPNPSNDNLLNNLDNPNRDVSRLLSYIDGESNTMESVFSFSTGFNWKEFKSEIQTMNKSQTGWGGLNFLGYADTSGQFAADKLKGKGAKEFDPYTSHQNNYTWGPIDVIDKIITRDKGIVFNQELSIKFKYAVRSYDGLSTKATFLDIMGNMFNMVTNKAPFWGGAVRFHGGGGYSGPLGDSKALKSGDVSGFLDSMVKGIGSKLSKPFENGLMEGIKSLAGNAGAALLGGSLDKLKRPEMYSLHSLLSANPTGEWHLTVGNPFNPAMMFGNLVMDGASFGVEGPFTADDVPSYILLEIKLKHAMPRDKYGIQRMFNYGGTRFYGSNTDFESKSYYRNRGTGKRGNLTPPVKIAQDTADSVNTENPTVKYLASNYQSLKASNYTA